MLTVEGGAQFTGDRVVVEPFNGGDVGARAGAGEGQAGPRRLAVEEHRAGATDSVLAAEMGPGQVEGVAQDVAEMRARLGPQAARTTVHGEV